MNHKELFNLRHAQARNVIERLFGVVKRRFRIMGVAPEYDLHTQALLVLAICVLHNVIRIHDPSDLNNADMAASLDWQVTRRFEDEFGCSITQEERERAGQHRDNLSCSIWDQYVQYMVDMTE